MMVLSVLAAISRRATYDAIVSISQLTDRQQRAPARTKLTARVHASQAACQVKPIDTERCTDVLHRLRPRFDSPSHTPLLRLPSTQPPPCNWTTTLTSVTKPRWISRRSQ